MGLSCSPLCPGEVENRIRSALIKLLFLHLPLAALQPNSTERCPSPLFFPSVSDLINIISVVIDHCFGPWGNVQLSPLRQAPALCFPWCACVRYSRELRNEPHRQLKQTAHQQFFCTKIVLTEVDVVFYFVMSMCH